MSADNDLSALKSLLCDRWDTLAHQLPPVFRYTLPAVSVQRTTDGPYRFLVQLNPDRTTKRRPPQCIRSLRPQFQPDDFNFNKIDEREVLVEIAVDALPVSLLINSSPLTHWHTLICPQRAANLPQVLTVEAVRCAVHLLLDFGERCWRIGYNSPGAWASVNHLHLHLVHRPESLYVDRVRLAPVAGCNRLYRLDGCRPVDAFAFRLTAGDDDDAGELCADVMRLVRLLCDRDIPHNVLFTLGDGVAERLRIVVFPKASASTAKEFSTFNVAFCELSGYVPLGNAALYDTLTEAEIVAKMRSNVGDVCERLADEVAELYAGIKG